jgi:hypothetical protein
MENSFLIIRGVRTAQRADKSFSHKRAAGCRFIECNPRSFPMPLRNAQFVRAIERRRNA